MARTERKSVARPEIDRELARKVQARLEKERKRAVSISETCEYALRFLHHELNKNTQ